MIFNLQPIGIFNQPSGKLFLTLSPSLFCGVSSKTLMCPAKSRYKPSTKNRDSSPSRITESCWSNPISKKARAPGFNRRKRSEKFLYRLANHLRLHAKPESDRNSGLIYQDSESLLEKHKGDLKPPDQKICRCIRPNCFV